MRVRVILACVLTTAFTQALGFLRSRGQSSAEQEDDAGGWSQQRQDQEQENATLSPVELGAAVFTIYLWKNLWDLALASINRKALADYPDCGTINSDIAVSGASCDAGCNYTTTNRKCATIFTQTLTLNNVNTKIEITNPSSLPDDITCLNSCNITNTNINQGFMSSYCQCKNLSCAACYLLMNSVPDYGDAASTTPSKYVYVIDSQEKAIFAYCLAEQQKYVANYSINSSTSYTSNSTVCNQLFSNCYSTTTTYTTTTTATTVTGGTGRKLGKDKKLGKGRKNRAKRDLGGDSDDGSLSVAINRYPYLCSLRERGFRGKHRCGVTLLSGPPFETILVSSAHCNFVCRNGQGRPVETCCCRKSTEATSCTKSSYCGSDSKVYRANPYDFQIVCGIWTQEEIPETQKLKDILERDVVLEIENITIHPNFVAGQPILGNDIAVYHVYNPEKLKTEIDAGRIKPACLPRTTYPTKKGILAGWIQPEPTFRAQFDTLANYVRKNFLPKESTMSVQACGDPAWMKSNTYYPPGTVCASDTSSKSCVTFGNSGSPLIRNILAADGVSKRFSWVGPLSMSKGCDLTCTYTAFTNIYKASLPRFNFAASNPAVFTDGYCYLDWIAEQYNLKPPVGWVKPASCQTGSVGNTADIDKSTCLAYTGKNCDFTRTNFTKCQVVGDEGFTYNIFQCFDTDGELSTCANNCRGVDPNAIVVGGIAAAFAVAAGSSSLLGPVLGVGGLGAAGFGAMQLMQQRTCPANQCRTRGGQCCALVVVNRRRVCPNFC